MKIYRESATYIYITYYICDLFLLERNKFPTSFNLNFDVYGLILDRRAEQENVNERIAKESLSPFQLDSYLSQYQT